MIEKVTQFLDNATEVKNKEAKQQYLNRDQFLPTSACFCLLCRAYKRKLHYCSALDKYVNIDERQMLLMEGDTAAEVEGLDSNTGKCTVFENRRIMKYFLFNRVGLEKEYKKQKVEHDNNKEKEESVMNKHGTWTKEN